MNIESRESAPGYRRLWRSEETVTAEVPGPWQIDLEWLLKRGTGRFLRLMRYMMYRDTTGQRIATASVQGRGALDAMLARGTGKFAPLL